MKKEPAFNIDRKKIVKFCKKNHIMNLALFGSVLTPRFSSASDVDVLVKFEQNHTPTLFGIVDMESELTEIFGRPVDLKTAGDLSSYFRDQVISEAKVIYESERFG